MSCWDRFDRKVVLYFTGNKDTRVPGMEKELARVGLEDADRQWQYPTPLDGVFLRSVRHIPCLEQKIGLFNATMGHYRAIATAYHLGCESVLIIEDDIRFLKDKSDIEDSVAAIPEDYDMALLDSFYRTWGDKKANSSEMSSWRDGRKANDLWSEFDMLCSGGCYALSRRGMKRMMFAFEAVETRKGIGKMRVSDHFNNRSILGADTRMYFARKNVAIQRDMGASNTPASEITGEYLDMGLDLDEYEEA